MSEEMDFNNEEIVRLHDDLAKERQRREQAEGLLREARLCLLDDKRVGNLCHRIDDHFGERDE